MTLPIERTRAVQSVRDFLRDLLDPKKTPRVSREIRERAYRCLRHYPSSFELRQSSEVIPKIWGEPEEDQ